MAEAQRLVQHGFNNIEIEKGKLLNIIADSGMTPNNTTLNTK